MPGKATVDRTSGAYEKMRPIWNMVCSLLGGTLAMREAATSLMPKYYAETDEAYKGRLGRAVLLNCFRKTVENLGAQPFNKPISLGESFPEDFKKLAEDIDKLGNDLTAWGREVFKVALAKGFVHILVDMPPADPNVQTLEDETKADRRPYFIAIPPENVIAAYSTSENGKETLTHVRIKECETIRKGYTEEIIHRVRVYERGTWEMWESKNNKDYVKVKEGKTGLDFIPLVTFYGHREGFMLSNPPLIDLAHKNVEHWQSSSDQRNVLTVARFPMLAGSGMANAELQKLTIGPAKILASENPEAKFYYVEHTGAAIAAGKADLDDLKDEMSMLGVELLVRKSGSTTATEKSINTAKSQSELGAMALRFADALELAFHYAARWMNQEVDDETLKLEVHTDFGIEASEAKDLELLYKARQTREISRSAFLAELKRRGVLMASFDEEDDKEKLDEETGEMAAQLVGKPGSGIVPPGVGGKVGAPPRSAGSNAPPANKADK